VLRTLGALFPELPLQCLPPALALQEEEHEEELEACSRRDWLLEELPSPPVTVGGGEGEVVSSPAFHPGGRHVFGGLLPFSLAMLMGFMTPLLAPEDRCEKGGGGGGGGGGVS